MTTKTKIDGVDLFPANLDLAGCELPWETGRDRTLRDAFRPIRKKYDFILIDCPPSLGILTINALVATSSLVVPVQAEYLCLRGLKQLAKIIEKVRKRANPGLQVKLLLTMHDTGIAHTAKVVEALKRVLSGRIYRAVINSTIKFADSTIAGLPIIRFAPHSEAAAEYRDFGRQVLRDAKTK